MKLALSDEWDEYIIRHKNKTSEGEYFISKKDTYYKKIPHHYFFVQW